jgi:serine/threonine protein kinase/Flp pilus assembly protein TadD
MIQSERGDAAEALFKAALERETGERAVFLAEAAAKNPELRKEAESLLAHLEAARTFLETPPFAAPAADLNDARQAGPHDACRLRGQRIGSYEILDLLAEGGMGVVYLAQQDHPPRRVALKLLHPGLATPGMLRRFEHEAEVLGRLQHPGIAQILEAGTAETGYGPQPFFAMELIEGRRLTDYAEARRLSILQRLELLEKVCDAVQHAHQKGVIHRDLKPANILVDATGQPKVLDFGVARVIDADLEAGTLHTEPGQLLGTIRYMSPEQVAGNPREVDTRSDVYALGLVGYELLAGRLPCNLDRKPLTEVVRAIAEEVPARLSSIHRVFRGDLETIFQKALEKEKDHRYSSVSAFSADLRHYLQDEPIAARSPSALYMLGKFARRNRGLTLGMGLTLLSLVAGLIAVSAYAVAARRSEAEARRAQAEAQSQRAEAEQSRDKSNAVTGFLVNMLTAANPTRLGREVLVKDVLDEASHTIGNQFAEQPLVEAYLQHVLGLTYGALGDYSRAESHLSRALTLRLEHLSDTHEDVAVSRNNLAYVLFQQGDYTRAEALHRQALASARALYGETHHRVARSLKNLGMVLQAQGNDAEAEASYRQALSICHTLAGQDDENTARATSCLAGLLVDRGDYAAAEPLIREALTMQRKLLGDEHPDLAITLLHLGALRQARGDYTGAESVLREALAMQRELLGDEHPDVAITLDRLGTLLQAEGDYDGAEPLLRQAIDVQRKRLGAEHPALVKSLKDLNMLLEVKGDPVEAERLLDEASAIDRLRGTENHTTTGPIR